MIILKRNHYIAALIGLALVVLFAVWRGEQQTLQAPGESVSPEAVSPSPSPAIETTAEAQETLVGVWIPYMSLSTAEKTEEAFKANYDAKLKSAKEMGVNAVFVHVRPFADSLYPS